MKKCNSITVAVLDLVNRFSSDLVHMYFLTINPFTSSITDDNLFLHYNAGYTYVGTGKPHNLNFCMETGLPSGK